MNNTPVLYETEPTDLDVYDDASMDLIPNREMMEEGQPPFLRRSQGARPINDEPENVGKWWSSLTNLFYDDASLEVAIISGQPKGQLLYPVKFDANNPALCSSDDGEKPIAQHERRAADPMDGPCAACDYSQWGPNRESPRCAEQEKLLLYERTTGIPHLISFHRTAIQPGRTLNNLLIAANKDRRWVVLGTYLKKSDKGSWYLPAATLGDKIPVAERRDIVTMRGAWGDFQAKADIREEPPASAAPQHDEGPGGPPLDNYDGPPLQEEEDDIPF